MTWTAPCARPAVSTGLAQWGAFLPLSGGCPVEVQDRPLVETGSPGSELLCSQPYGKCEQGRTKQHRSLLASLSGTQQNAMQSRQVESALAENLITVGESRRGRRGTLEHTDPGCSPGLKTIEKGNPEEKRPPPNPEAARRCSSAARPQHCPKQLT